MSLDHWVSTGLRALYVRNKHVGGWLALIFKFCLFIYLFIYGTISCNLGRPHTHYIAGNVLEFWILLPLPSMTPCPHFKVEDTSTETGKDFPAITQTAKANWVLFGESGLLFHAVQGSTSQNQLLSTFMSLCRCDWFSKGLCVHLFRTAHASCWDFSSLPVSLVTHKTLPLKELLHVLTVTVLVHQDTPHSACCVLGMLPTTHAYDLPPSPIPLDP